MKSWTRRIAATAGAVGLAAWVAGVPNLPALAAGHADGMATNPYSPATGHDYRKGVVPTRAQAAKMKSWDAGHTTTGANTLQYNGGIDGIGVTSGTPKVYLVFWGSGWGTQGAAGGNVTFTGDYAGAAPYLQNLFKGIGTGELWSGTLTQYCDGSVSVGATSCPSGAAHVGYASGPTGAYAGVWYDTTDTYPTGNAPTGHQLAAEAVTAAGHFTNTTAASNRYAQYDILSAPGTNPDSYETQGFCAWHDYNGDTTLTGGAASSPYGDIAFTNMPYVADAGGSCGAGFVNSGSNLDGFSIVNGHEFAETITDQNPAGGWINFRNGYENGDECAWISSGTGAAADVSMTTGSFAMQSTWSNDTNNCAISHPIVGGSGGGSSDFTISDNPTTGGVTAGSGTAVTTVSTTAVGTAGTVVLSTSALPSGVSANFGSSSISAGTSTSLSFSASGSAGAGTYPISITGTEGSAVHSTTYSLTVNPASTGGGNIIVNGGFETGTFSGWTTSGAATNIVTGPIHTGSYAAAAGYFSPAGISSIAQTFTAPSGDSHLTFWYYTVCGGSPTSNYATVTLKDTGTGATTSPLAKTCATTSGWRQVTVSISAGHNYTLTLMNRDSRTRTTYAAYDDVATS